MEIDISEFVRTGEVCDFSASAAELGPEAGKITWHNAMREAAETPLLTTPDQIQALKDYCGEMGAWSDEEIEQWSDEACNALFIQEISSRLRDVETDENGDYDWEAESKREDGGGQIYPGDDGHFYFYLGS